MQNGQDADGIAAVTQVQYSADSQSTCVTDPKGLHTHYIYYALGDLLQVISPDTGSVNMVVDAAGNTISRTDARGVTATFAYDALNRVTSIAFPDPTQDVALTYDVSACGSAERRPVDQNYRPTAVHDMASAGLSISLGYDPAGSVTELRSADTHAVLPNTWAR